jgi:hypothetical protein
MGVLVYDVPHAAIADAEAGDIGAVATITNTTRFAAIFLPGTYGPVSLLTFGPYIAGAGALTGGASALAGAGTLTITGNAFSKPGFGDISAADAGEVLTVPGSGTNGGRYIVGPFPTGRFNNSSGQVSYTLDVATGMSVAAITVPQQS